MHLCHQSQIPVQPRGHDHQISDVHRQHQHALPPLEPPADDGGDDGDQRYHDGHGEVQIDVLGGYRQLAAVHEGTDRQNEGGVDDVGADDVAHGHRRLLLDEGRDSRHQLRQGGADGHDGDADDGLGHAPGRGDETAVAHQQLRAHYDAGRAAHDAQNVQHNGFPVAGGGLLGLLRTGLPLGGADVLRDIQQEDEQQHRRPCDGEAAAAGEQEQRAHRRDEQDALGREAPFVHGDGHEDDADGQDHGGVADDGADAVADGHAHLVL